MFPLANPLVFALGAGFLRSFVRLRVLGREHLPPPAAGGWLLASNHRSHFDPPLLSAAAGRWVDWAAMIELFRHPWATAFWRGLAAFPVDRAQPVDRAAARVALSRLRAGRVVGIFPERGIRPPGDGVLGPRGEAALDAGVCRLALAAGVPIIPAAIFGSETLYAPGGWLLPGVRRFRVTVAFGPPLRAGAVTGATAPKAAATELKTRLAREINRLAREAALACPGPSAGLGSGRA